MIASPKAGEYQVEVAGRYFADFDHAHPLEGPARAQAWSPTAHALIGELGVGTVTASALQMGLGLAGLFAGIGFAFVLAGLGLVWATSPEAEKVPVLRPAAFRPDADGVLAPLTQHVSKSPPQRAGSSAWHPAPTGALAR